MNLQRDLVTTALLANPGQLATLRRHLPKEWIEQALEATGKASVRRRCLPAEQVVWLVLGIALYRDRPILDVVDKLDLSIETGKQKFISSSGVVQARDRLGPEPLRWLFERTADHWTDRSADAHRWRGLALYGLDGSTLRVPDTPENRQHFGLAGGGRGESGYPLLRLVAVMALRSHLLAGCEYGPYATSEIELADRLWKTIPDESLTILDRQFLSGEILLGIRQQGTQRHWLIRPKKNTKTKTIKTLGPGDELVELNVSPQVRRRNPSLPRRYQARLLTYKCRGKQRVILTSLVDCEKYPADEVAKLYEERWEIEQGYDEIKSEVLLSEETLRCKTPERIDQELWGVFLAYNLIRLEMEQIAHEAAVEPIEISFVTALRFIQDEWMWCAIASPGAIPRQLRNLRANLKRFVLPPRRKHRMYPRAVKIKMSSYPRKRPENAG